jgi:hypothetical protein
VTVPSNRNLELAAGTPGVIGDHIISAMSRLVRRRRRVRRDLVVETTAALVGAVACLITQGWRSRSERPIGGITVNLALIAIVLAARDHRRLQLLNVQLDMLARSIEPFL